jgi:peptide/nickel transport system ATP-binding protein
MTTAAGGPGPVVAAGSPTTPASATASAGPILRVEGLVKHFPLSTGAFGQRSRSVVKAVDGVSFEVAAGETVAIVGESGCGKSTLARCIARLVEPTAGSITFEGRDLTHLDRSAMAPLRRDLMMIFQDPFGSLDPRMRVGSIIAEPLVIHRWGTHAEIRDRVVALLRLVGLNPEHYNRLPHEFSGGQRQRIGIARALALGPKLIVCDEPVSALDVSIQAQILNLLADLQEELGLTYVFITHNLDVVRHVADRVLVMYLGRIVEEAPAADLYRLPRHPYTAALLSAVPVPDPIRSRARRPIVLEGDVPSPVDPPAGCRFHPRCPRVQPICRTVAPERRLLDVGRTVECHAPIERWPYDDPAEIRIVEGLMTPAGVADA